MYIRRFLSQIVYPSQTNFEFLMAFLNMPCPTCLISFRTCRKTKLTFPLQWFDYEKGLGSIKFCFREILGQTVWTKIRPRPSKGFWELGKKVVYCQGAWEQGLYFGEMHHFPACVYGLLMEGGGLCPKPQSYTSILQFFSIPFAKMISDWHSG